MNGREIEKVISIVMALEEEAETKMNESEDKKEEEAWERVSEEANNVIRTWKRTKNEAITHKGIKAEEEAKIDAKEKEIKREQQKEKEDALRAQADTNKKAIEAKEKEKEDALKAQEEVNKTAVQAKEEALGKKERELQEMTDNKKKLEEQNKQLAKELAETKQARDMLISRLSQPRLQLFTDLSTVFDSYHAQSDFFVTGNSIQRKSDKGYCTITLGPELTTV